ncbi:WhiB family transcriptional regulator [Luteipulveratus mongoliensis]|uniref:WhiB family transcriptional regulator n=1 Tax=Luteipulveratus mongoliensis TaxID=571913 RepID=UPI001C54EFCE|nr:WhiB family transcriptional regulator [Luteipulveratus mongoliensis]
MSTNTFHTIDVAPAPPPWLVAGALCNGAADPDRWWPTRRASRRKHRAHAAAVCAGCPVRAACLTYAQEAGQEYGIWGGLSEQDRRDLRRTP